MTKEEILQYIKSELANENTEIYLDVDDYKIIVKALEQKACDDWDINNLILVNKENYESAEQESNLDKIRAEIDKIYEREGNSVDCLNALDELKEFIDKCRAESGE